MKLLLEAELRCASHEAYAANCALCRWLRDFEEELRLVKEHRNRMVKDLEKKLATREILIVGVR
jgi:hypothetical protein